MQTQLLALLNGDITFWQSLALGLFLTLLFFIAFCLKLLADIKHCKATQYNFTKLDEPKEDEPPHDLENTTPFCIMPLRDPYVSDSIEPQPTPNRHFEQREKSNDPNASTVISPPPTVILSNAKNLNDSEKSNTNPKGDPK